MKIRTTIVFTIASLMAANAAFGQAGTVNTSGSGTAGVVISGSATYPEVHVKTGTPASSFRVFNSDNLELFRVTGSGTVRIAKSGRFDFDVSATNPVLTLTGGDANAYYPQVVFAAETGAEIGRVFGYKYTGMYVSGGSGMPIMLTPGGTEAVRILPNGNFGIGLTAPTQRLEIAGKVRAVGTGGATMAGNGTDYYGGGRQSVYGAPVYGTAEGDGAAYTYGAINTENTGYLGGKAGAYLRGGNGIIYAGGGAGLVAIGGDAVSGSGSSAEGGAGIYARGGLNAAGSRTYAGYFAGDVVVTGNIGAKYQDVAEWVPATEKLAAGTVVVLDTARSNHVTPSSRPYDTTVAGVVSAQPGLILGEGGDSKAMVATTGRVRVRVDATRHPIAIGDLLVTGNKPGVAMKSVPVSVQGIAMHRPGTVVGKALEPLERGEGEILVLLSLQ